MAKSWGSVQVGSGHQCSVPDILVSCMVWDYKTYREMSLFVYLMWMHPRFTWMP